MFFFFLLSFLPIQSDTHTGHYDMTGMREPSLKADLWNYICITVNCYIGDVHHIYLVIYWHCFGLKCATKKKSVLCFCCPPATK